MPHWGVLKVCVSYGATVVFIIGWALCGRSLWWSSLSSGPFWLWIGKVGSLTGLCSQWQAVSPPACPVWTPFWTFLSKVWREQPLWLESHSSPSPEPLVKQHRWMGGILNYGACLLVLGTII